MCLISAIFAHFLQNTGDFLEQKSTLWCLCSAIFANICNKFAWKPMLPIHIPFCINGCILCKNWQFFRGNVSKSKSLVPVAVLRREVLQADLVLEVALPTDRVEPAPGPVRRVQQRRRDGDLGSILWISCGRNLRKKLYRGHININRLIWLFRPFGGIKSKNLAHNCRMTSCPHF
jgi:hypothetical protein